MIRRRSEVAAIVGAVAIVGLLALPASLAPPGSSAAQRTLQTSASGGGRAGSNPYVCAFNTTPDSSDRDVKLSAPTFSLASGDKLTTTYQLEVAATTLRSIDLAVTIPSLFAKFPLSSGTDLTSYLAPRTITLTNSSWSSASLGTNTKSITSATSFSGAPAFMTSELLALMGNASYQTVTLAFRWDWSVTFASNGTTVTSAWSRVSTSGPSANTFYPAPYVTLLSKSSTTVAIGADFTATLGGAISDTAFHSVLENASTGNVLINTPTDTAPGTLSSVAVSVNILPPDHPLGPSTLLDHVRNVCGALLYSISLKAVYAASANVTIAVTPTTCGKVTFNGSSYSNGAVLTLPPSSTSVSISAGTCSGHPFLGWSRASGVWVATPSSLSSSATISASGNLTARFS